MTDEQSKHCLTTLASYTLPLQRHSWYSKRDFIYLFIHIPLEGHSWYSKRDSFLFIHLSLLIYYHNFHFILFYYYYSYLFEYDDHTESLRPSSRLQQAAPTPPVSPCKLSIAQSERDENHFLNTTVDRTTLLLTAKAFLDSLQCSVTERSARVLMLRGRVRDKRTTSTLTARRNRTMFLFT